MTTIKVKRPDGTCTPYQQRHLMRRLEKLRPNWNVPERELPKMSAQVKAAEETIVRLRKIVSAHEKRVEIARDNYRNRRRAEVGRVENLILFGQVQAALKAVEALEAEDAK